MTGAVAGSDWRGTAFLAIANSVDPALHEDYETWHTFEHVPERLTMPGFLGGRRFMRERERERHYLTLYDLDDTAALETAAYRHLLTHPTPASRRMRPAMAEFQRLACRETARFGHGCGRCLGLLRWRVAPSDESPVDAEIATLIGRAGLVSARLGRSVEAGAHPAFPTDPAAPAGQAVALLSGTDPAGMASVLAAIADSLPGPVLACEVYELIVSY